MFPFPFYLIPQLSSNLFPTQNRFKDAAAQRKGFVGDKRAVARIVARVEVADLESLLDVQARVFFKSGFVGHFSFFFNFSKILTRRIQLDTISL